MTTGHWAQAAPIGSTGLVDTELPSDPSRALPAALELRGVVRRYPGVTALAGVDLRVDRGELVAVVGRSGSGKSTLLNVAGTLDRTDEGSACIDGIDIARLSDRELSALRARTLSFVFQSFHLHPGRSALDNVADGLLYGGVPRAERRRRAAAALEVVGLADRLDHRPGQLSGGQRQRVAIARAVVRRPLLLLADEPTGNLDSASAMSVLNLLLGLNAGGTAVVVVTHDHDLASRLPRRVIMQDGHAVSDETDRT